MDVSLFGESHGACLAAATRGCAALTPRTGHISIAADLVGSGGGPCPITALLLVPAGARTGSTGNVGHKF